MATLGERRSCRMSRIVTLLVLMVASCGFAAEAVIDCVKVAAKSKINPVITVWYRVPRNYDKAGSAKHRVLVLFGGRSIALCNTFTDLCSDRGMGCLWMWRLSWPTYCDIFRCCRLR